MKDTPEGGRSNRVGGLLWQPSDDKKMKREDPQCVLVIAWVKPSKFYSSRAL